jgi:hypothetical protein
MPHDTYAKHWKRFYWSDSAVQVLALVAFNQSFIRWNHLPNSIFYGFLGVIISRLLFHWLVRCPRCHQRFFRRLYMLDARHQCQHCGLDLKPR